jgi:hypothetical protein
MRKALLFGLFFFSGFVLNAQKTEIIYLTGTDKDHTVQWDFFCTNGRNSGMWSKIAVPSNWELQGFGTYHYGQPDLIANEKGLYKYEFSISGLYAKKRVYIVFEGSMTDTEVKVNGKIAGPVHQGAFYRFKYDISDLLNFGGKNLLEVTVSKESANESINRAERTSDYWVFGGIYRPVYLEIVPSLFIDHTAIDAKATGSFHMDVFTSGKGNGKTIEARVQTIEGKSFGPLMSATIAENQSKIVVNGNFSDPLLWNPEFPQRYQVIVSLKEGNTLLHQITQKFGFRTVEVKAGDGIYVNNKKVIFRGVCRHTFWPSSGRTSSKQLAIDDINLMKDMNMNAVRMSHYPPDQFFLDACDSLGLFVLDELAGWQNYYDTPTAHRLVKEMVERDVNHPSVVLWDNGNEGGFNKDVRNDYALYDPQKRTVIEPWSTINGINTKHYPGFKYVENALNNGSDIYFPTEFLHGLYDGGLGAGLDDYWNLMMSKPLSAGGFLWVFADEGVERRDLNDSIDTNGNSAPDGILGPYHEKEGSFYTIREIWSPVCIPEKKLKPDFNGKFPVINRYSYTNLKLCKYYFELVIFENKFPEFKTKKLTGTVPSPDIEPGASGFLTVNMPTGWEKFDVLYVTATDQYNRKINTWSWNITQPKDFISREIEANSEKVIFTENDSLFILASGKAVVSLGKKDGLINEVKSSNKIVSFVSGPQFTGLNPKLKREKHFFEGNNYSINLIYDNGCQTIWTMLPGGTLKLDYEYIPKSEMEFSGISFLYPENLVTGAILMANGPYHTWKNRLKGSTFGVFKKEYNNTITGQTWIYPEFKGYYSNFYAVRILTKEMPITIFTSTSDLFLHLFTPGVAKFSIGKGLRNNFNPSFPSGNISFLHGISPIGTKFSTPESEGPQGDKNIYSLKPLRGTLYFRFGN